MMYSLAVHDYRHIGALLYAHAYRLSLVVMFQRKTCDQVNQIILQCLQEYSNSTAVVTISYFDLLCIVFECSLSKALGMTSEAQG